MKVPTTQAIRLGTLFYSMALMAACAAPNRADFNLKPAPGPLALISEEDVLHSHGTTAYEVVERLKPMYLDSKVDLAPTEERQVYLNGVKLGGVSELRWIAARDVKEIRFVRAIDGGVYGVGRSGGAILVISKSGR